MLDPLPNDISILLLTVHRNPYPWYIESPAQGFRPLCLGCIKSPAYGILIMLSICIKLNEVGSSNWCLNFALHCNKDYPWYIELSNSPAYGISTPPLPLVYWTPYALYFDIPLSTVYGTPYSWYFDRPTHGISNLISLVYRTLSYGIMNPLSTVYRKHYPWYFDTLPKAYYTLYPW